ncbi:acyl transferase/acyl hydrolase/lysophospholipase [Lineolata rhizophorae]|uniref:Lysophospholipase n=1 Tax=Lineolata rhizophorae TaxID=578093 RepID=A0A6A6NWY7_9PEZI|nr:acyl transferase/acyl hydrolase/lysophospholipase [Lineolata rhizophorae]
MSLRKSQSAKTEAAHSVGPKECKADASDRIAGKLSSTGGALSSVEWGDLPSTLTNLIIPDWMRLLPAFLTKLQDELSMAPGSLSEEIWREANDPEINPEIIWDASVRVSDDLCDEEKIFRRQRKRHTTRALAKYLGIPEQEIHPDDVPTIAMCGSGGGLRALVAGSSSYLSTQEDGLFDCITYTAGVSGSCWLQSLYYTSIAGQSHHKLIEHLKHRLGVHIAFPPAALALLNSAPTNKYLLSGIVEKLKASPQADFGIVDVYGLLLAARLLVPKGELQVNDMDLKISNQRRFIDGGSEPLPIYTAVRHEIPLEDQSEAAMAEREAESKKEAWFQWFEFTPYEFWCEELQAGIPTWAVGREFERGRTKWRDNGLSIPETRLPLMLGIWGSAFCATLSHYYREIRPIMTNLAGFGGIDEMIAERDADLIKVHPIDPAAIPNFAFSMHNLLPPGIPRSIFEQTHLKLMDAGMSNNLPVYPLLRPGRDVDILIAFDASADVKTDNWLRVADGYVRQRGIKGWPVGAGWPPPEESPAEVAADLDAAHARTEEETQAKMGEAERADAKAKAADKTKEAGGDDGGGDGSTSRVGDDRHESNWRRKKGRSAPRDLSYCNVWIGSTEERTASGEPPQSKLVEEDWELMHPAAGIAVIYFPFLANPRVPGIDPRQSDFLSTWNFVYTPEQVDKVVALARANFDEGREQTRRTVRAVYERKKMLREERERSEWEKVREWRRRRKMRSGLMGRKGVGDHGDHFS